MQLKKNFREITESNHLKVKRQRNLQERLPEAPLALLVLQLYGAVHLVRHKELNLRLVHQPLQPQRLFSVVEVLDVLEDLVDVQEEELGEVYQEVEVEQHHNFFPKPVFFVLISY